MKVRSSHNTRSEFEMSSMTDLIFLILLFFVLLSTMIIPNVNALKLLLPNSNTATKKENLEVSVAINEKSEFFIGDQSVSADQLQSVLENFLRDKTNPVVMLHAHKSVPIEQVVKVLDVANRLKVKLVLATNPEK